MLPVQFGRYTSENMGQSDEGNKVKWTWVGYSLVTEVHPIHYFSKLPPDNAMV